MTPPETIFYSETGGKSAPFYMTLAGIKSAFKTSWGGRVDWRYYPGQKAPKVYRGTVTWTEIDVKTGEPVV